MRLVEDYGVIYKMVRGTTVRLADAAAAGTVVEGVADAAGQGEADAR